MSAPRQVRPESGGRRALLDTPLSREQTLAAVQDAITADSDLSRGAAAVTIGVRLFAGIRREAGVGELTLVPPISGG